MTPVVVVEKRWLFLRCVKYFIGLIAFLFGSYSIMRIFPELFSAIFFGIAALIFAVIAILGPFALSEEGNPEHTSVFRIFFAVVFWTMALASAFLCFLSNYKI